MAFSFLYLAVRALLGVLIGSRRGLHAKDIELLVLRHELEILRRQVARPKLRMVVLTAAACHLPRSSRGVLFSMSSASYNRLDGNTANHNPTGFILMADSDWNVLIENVANNNSISGFATYDVHHTTFWRRPSSHLRPWDQKWKPGSAGASEMLAKPHR